MPKKKKHKVHPYRAGSRTNVIIGAIVGIADHGSIVEVSVEVSASKQHPVYFDHRCFANMARDQEACGGLIGRRVRISGTTGEETIEFLDD